jgi:hypothetical protein
MDLGGLDHSSGFIFVLVDLQTPLGSLDDNRPLRTTDMNEAIKELNRTKTSWHKFKASGAVSVFGMWTFLTVVVCILGVEGLRVFIS